MSLARLSGLTLMAAALALPALAAPEVMLRGRFDAEQMPVYDRDTTEAPTMLPVAMVTEASARTIYLTTPAKLRTGQKKPVAAMVAEGRGQDPDRAKKAAKGYPAS